MTTTAALIQHGMFSNNPGRPYGADDNLEDLLLAIDPTADDEDLDDVDVAPRRPARRPVLLEWSPSPSEE